MLHDCHCLWLWYKYGRCWQRNETFQWRATLHCTVVIEYHLQLNDVCYNSNHRHTYCSICAKYLSETRRKWLVDYPGQKNAKKKVTYKKASPQPCLFEIIHFWKFVNGMGTILTSSNNTLNFTNDIMARFFTIKENQENQLYYYTGFIQFFYSFTYMLL